MPGTHCPFDGNSSPSPGRKAVSGETGETAFRGKLFQAKQLPIQLKHVPIQLKQDGKLFQVKQLPIQLKHVPIQLKHVPIQMKQLPWGVLPVGSAASAKCEG